jgi:hypothetical protein
VIEKCGEIKKEGKIVDEDQEEDSDDDKKKTNTGLLNKGIKKEKSFDKNRNKNIKKHLHK